MTQHQKKQELEIDDSLSFEDRAYIQDMKDYIADLHPTKEEATAALIRTGVLNEDGSPKEHICNVLSE